MCMARAYFEGETDEERELLLEDIALVECDGKRVRISSLFGETKEVEGVIREVDFQSGSIVLERCC